MDVRSGGRFESRQDHWKFLSYGGESLIETGRQAGRHLDALHHVVKAQVDGDNAGLVLVALEEGDVRRQLGGRRRVAVVATVDHRGRGFTWTTRLDQLQRDTLRGLERDQVVGVPTGRRLAVRIGNRWLDPHRRRDA